MSEPDWKALYLQAKAVLMRHDYPNSDYLRWVFEDIHKNLASLNQKDGLDKDTEPVWVFEQYLRPEPSKQIRVMKKDGRLGKPHWMKKTPQELKAEEELFRSHTGKQQFVSDTMASIYKHWYNMKYNEKEKMWESIDEGQEVFLIHKSVAKSYGLEWPVG